MSNAWEQGIESQLNELKEQTRIYGIQISSLQNDYRSILDREYNFIELQNKIRILTQLERDNAGQIKELKEKFDNHDCFKSWNKSKFDKKDSEKKEPHDHNWVYTTGNRLRCSECEAIKDSEGEKIDYPKNSEEPNPPPLVYANEDKDDLKPSEPIKFDLRKFIQIAYDLAQPKKELRGILPKGNDFMAKDDRETKENKKEKSLFDAFTRGFHHGMATIISVFDIPSEDVKKKLHSIGLINSRIIELYHLWMREGT